MEIDLLYNAFTNRDFEYFKSKSLDLCIIVPNKATKKVSMKCSLPVAQVQKILFREGGSATDETWISESRQEKFLCQKIYDKNLIHLH